MANTFEVLKTQGRTLKGIDDFAFGSVVNTFEVLRKLPSPLRRRKRTVNYGHCILDVQQMLNSEKMPQKRKEVIAPSKYYHIFNRGVNRRTIFREQQDFQRFLLLSKKYILPIGSLFAYALMEDHFHLLISTKSVHHLPAKFLTDKHKPGRQFSHLQNAYAKYFNGKYRTVSGLFERSFEREEVGTFEYFQNVVLDFAQKPN